MTVRTMLSSPARTAVLAVQMIATGDEGLAAKLRDYKKELSEGLKL